MIVNTIRTAIANWLIRVAFRAAPNDYTPPAFLSTSRGGGGGPKEPA